MSAGINLYEEMRPLFGPLNEAVSDGEASLIQEKAAELRQKRGPCIFLSHKSEDKDAVRAIARYIERGGIDIYLAARQRSAIF